MTACTTGHTVKSTAVGSDYLVLKDEIDEAVARVLSSGRYLAGVECEAFESEFAHYTGVGFGIGAASGTDALMLALRACGIGEGDGVVTVAHTAVATVAAIDLVSAVPILIDVDEDTETMDPDLLEETLRSNTHPRIRAVIPVHLYGQPAPMETILRLARQYGIFVIEDCAQSHGAALNGNKTGSFGDLGAFSFYPTKNLGAVGDAGMLVTSDGNLAQIARQLQQYGWRQRYISELPGMNTRLDELQAAILRVKLPHLDDWNRRRRDIAACYSQSLRSSSLQIPPCSPGGTHVFHQYVVRTPYRDELRAHLQEDGIETAVLYPQPVHMQPGYIRRIMKGVGGLAVTERLARELLCLPIHPHLTLEQVRAVVLSIDSWERWRRRK